MFVVRLKFRCVGGGEGSRLCWWGDFVSRAVSWRLLVFVVFALLGRFLFSSFSLVGTLSLPLSLPSSHPLFSSSIFASPPSLASSSSSRLPARPPASPSPHPRVLSRDPSAFPALPTTLSHPRPPPSPASSSLATSPSVLPTFPSAPHHSCLPRASHPPECSVVQWVDPPGVHKSI